MTEIDYKRIWRALKEKIVIEFLGNHEELLELKEDTQFHKTCAVLDKRLTLILSDMDELDETEELKHILAEVEKTNRRKYKIILNRFMAGVYQKEFKQEGK